MKDICDVAQHGGDNQRKDISDFSIKPNMLIK